MRDTIKYTDYKRFGSTSKIIYDGKEISTPDSKPPDQQPKDQQKPH
jgi:hypothetical protein